MHEPENGDIEVPRLKDSGSSGSQVESTEHEADLSISTPLAELPITKTVQGLASTHSRSMGGEVAASLIAGSFNQLNHTLEATQKELRETREKLDEARKDLAEKKTDLAITKQKLDSLKTVRRLRQLSLAGGPVLVAIGIDAGLSLPSVVLGVIGVALLAIGILDDGSRQS